MARTPGAPVSMGSGGIKSQEIFKNGWNESEEMSWWEQKWIDTKGMAEWLGQILIRGIESGNGKMCEWNTNECELEVWLLGLLHLGGETRKS